MTPVEDTRCPDCGHPATAHVRAPRCVHCGCKKDPLCDFCGCLASSHGDAWECPEGYL